MTDKYRISVTLPDTLRAQIEELKKDEYYNLSYSELYRQAISAGIESIKKCKNEGTNFITVADDAVRGENTYD